jgi:hypothetical protein
MEKKLVWAVFSSTPTPAHLRARVGLPARYHTTVIDRWGPPVGAVFPQILLARALPGIAAAIPAGTLSTRHHPFVTRMPACAPATLSRRVSCGAP